MYERLDEKNKISTCQRYTLRTVFIYGCLLSAIFLFIFDVYFEKFNINKKIIDTLWLKTQNFSLLTSFNDDNNNSVCSPYNNLSNMYKIEINNEIYPKFVPLFNNPNLNYKCLNKNKKRNLILLWNKWFGDSTFGYGIGNSKPFEQKNCPVTNCEITNDHNRLNESDLIVFHMRDPINGLPQYRTLNQHWIFLLYESPVHSANFEEYNNLFNISATYKIDSNFTSLYYKNYIWVNDSGFNINNDFTKDKTDFAAIVVSNCHDNSRRLEYVKQLQQSIQVSVFGKCGKPCLETFDNGTKANCKEIIASKYKFFLAFENSICKDYVTEKFFDILPYNIIPVVLGGGNYNTFVPKSGYINALDFKTPKHLADYLIYLDNNKTAYNDYFKWKKHVKFINDGPKYHYICEFCIHLNLDLYEGVRNSVIKDMKTFWSLQKDCKSSNELILN